MQSPGEQSVLGPLLYTLSLSLYTVCVSCVCVCDVFHVCAGSSPREDAQRGTPGGVGVETRVLPVPGRPHCTSSPSCPPHRASH